MIELAATRVAALDTRAESDTDLLTVLSGLQRLWQVVEAQKLARLREAEIRNLPSTVGAAHPLPWTADLVTLSRKAASAGGRRPAVRDRGGSPHGTGQGGF